MSGHFFRTNRWLVTAAVLVCILSGGLFTHSAAAPSRDHSENSTGVLIAENTKDNKSTQTTEKVTDLKETKSTKDTGDTEKKATITPTPAKSSAKEDSPADKDQETENKVSPEAKKGVWTASGSDWTFLVDGNAYTGWLTDTDGKRYYFDKAGIMQTGWVDVENKRYYMDLDGIMQTGDITVDGKTYHLNADGSLQGYEPSAVTAQSDSSDKKSKKKKKTTQKTIALTFDDGPSSFTDRLLDCLEANNAKATFFMVGKEILSFPDEVKRMKALGCELGNHTYDHTDLATLSASDISSQISKVDQELVNLTGQGATVVRPPYGSVNDTVKATVGTPMILWSIDTLDWKTQDVQATVEEVMNNVQDGSIILMHDIYSTSVDAAEILIPQLIEDGYQLVTVHELAATHGKELNPGVTYGEFTN
nr:polysaccharide deacetylase family protein [uncultured Blautia sp.]